MKTGLKLTLTASLLAGASSTALTGEARAAQVVFGAASLKGQALEPGRAVVLTDGVTQLRLDGGAMASFVGGAEFAVRSGNAIDLRRGTVTIASPAGAEVVVHMPNGVEGRLTGARGAAAFTAGADEARGHVMSGSVQVLARTGGTRSFGGGQFWRSGAQDGPSRIANAEAPAATPVLAGGRAGPAVAAGAASVPDLAAGPVAVAEAGLPVALGEALAAAGASGDVVAAARSVEASAGNPSLQAFPVGDYGTLVAYAAQLSGPYGGPAFAGAGPDIVRTYLQYLAGGGARETFLQSYAGLMLQYLDLVRSGAAPSSFSGASVQQINDFLAFQARTSGFAGLSSQNRALVDAYRAFLAGGGNPNAFARTYADLANAYFDYLRGGGSPAGFTGASQATVNAYLAFLRDSGMTGQLTPANRALLDAYLAGGAGLAFADQYRAALSAYYAHLVGGNLPSAYTPANAAQLRAYLETLESTGLLQGVLGAQADFFQAYLDHLQAGGAADAYAGLPANIFSGYAGAIDAFRLHLAAGNLPSAYAGLPAATLRAYLEALASAGQLQRYLGANADFFGAYLEYLRTGGSADAWAGLPANIFSGYASALSAYSAFLAAGNLPSAYANVPPETLRAYLEALDEAGLLDRYLGGSAALLDAYLEHLRAGGGIDAFAGLPANIYAGYGAQLDAYYAFLANGGLPSAYTALSQAQIAAYLDALQESGALERFLGANAGFYASYRTYLAGGGNPDLFAGLPSPPDFPAYTAAVQAYAAYLRAGGLPSAYAELDAATIQRYLQALDTAGLLGDALLDAYLDHLRAGGVPEAFAGLPVYASYASALSAYYDFLAGGGLPSAYGALTPAQVTAYLQALSSAGVLDDLLAGQQAFLSAYLAFVQNGGSPDRFAGLPVLASYGDALRAYLAYVAGGGLPSAYATLTPAQILAYLTALQEAGLLDQMLAGAPDGAAYAAYLLNGGAPDGFAGLPVLASYGAAVQAYLAFVSGGGLPSSYGALTPGQIVAYLAALRDAGLLDQMLAGAPAGAAYAAYLLNGGSPDRFPGLPVLATYGTAVQAYFTYIGGGGRPSQYGAATQSQIVDYINALEAAGLLATSYAAADRQLLLDYAAYVAGGNNPDQFAGLPPAPLMPLPAPNHAYAGGFTPSATHSYKAVTPTSAGQLLLTSQNNGVQMASNAQGQVTQLANMIRSDTSQVLDAAGNSSVVVGRWTGGSYIAGNQVVPVGAQSLHYYAAAPTTLAVPGAGRIDYAILAATQPTYDSGYGAAGLFDGALSIDFATRRAGLQGEIQMPEQGGPIAYAFTTAGGTAAPSAELTLTDPSSFAIGAAMTGSGRGCGGSCSLVFNGGFAGSSAENLGFVYYSVGSTVSDPIQGAVAFHGQQTGDGNPLPAPTYAYAPGLSGSSLRHIVDYARLSDGRRQSQISNGSAILSNGGATAIDSATGTDFYRDTAQQADVWGDERVLVGRWTNGNFRTGSATGPVQTLTQQSAVHYVLMQTPNFLMPYTGRIDYTLLAATRPTYIGGGTLPGIFDASLSIAFASTPRVGITGSIRMPESNGVVSYAFTSAGGTATPSVDLVIQPTDYFTFSTPFTGNGTACTGTCTITFNGSFSGADPLRVGMTYGTQGPQGQAGPQIHGAAAFAGAWVGAPQSLTRVSDRPFFSTALRNDTLNPGEGSTYDVNDLGQVVGLTSFNGLYDRLGGARIADSGSLAGNLVGWTRWTDGTLDTRRNGPPTPVTLAANGSYQIMHGAPLINMPTSGTASYTLIDGTQTADAFGAIGPGGVASGTARIAFGSTAKIGFDIHAQFNGNSYNLFTTGRTADVSASELTIAANGRFNAFGPGGNVISTGSDCAGGACRPIWNGFLAGDGATGIGLHYRVQDTVARNLDFHGIAAFTRDGASAAAPSAKMAMAAPQWQDWAVASATVAAPGMAAPDMPGVAAPTIGAGSLDKLRERANEVLGGRVRF